MDCIVVPTYSEHYHYNAAFLESFQKHCTDPGNAKVIFIAQHSTKEQLALDAYPFASMQSLTEILDTHGIQTPEETLLNSVGKHTYQSLKKLYGVLASGCDRVIVMDSENICVRDFAFHELFDAAFNRRLLYYPGINFGLQAAVTTRSKNILRLRLTTCGSSRRVSGPLNLL